MKKSRCKIKEAQTKKRCIFICIHNEKKKCELIGLTKLIPSYSDSYKKPKDEREEKKYID